MEAFCSRGRGAANFPFLWEPPSSAAEANSTTHQPFFHSATGYLLVTDLMVVGPCALASLTGEAPCQVLHRDAYYLPFMEDTERVEDSVEATRLHAVESNLA